MKKNSIILILALFLGIITWLYIKEKEKSDSFALRQASLKIIDSLANEYDRKKQYLKDSLERLSNNSNDSSLRAFGTDIEFIRAQRYVCNFMKSDGYKGMHSDSIVSILFTKESFAKLIQLATQSLAIDGVRVYLGKYTKDPTDPNPASHSSRYAMIAVGTKENSSTHSYEDKIYITPALQDYGEPCRPNCNGASLIPIDETGPCN